MKSDANMYISKYECTGNILDRVSSLEMLQILIWQLLKTRNPPSNIFSVMTLVRTPGGKEDVWSANQRRDGLVEGGLVLTWAAGERDNLVLTDTRVSD